MDFNINEKEIVHNFKVLADELILKKELVVNNEKFRFTEIEFYFFSKNHPDVYTHEHDYEAGKWRFHIQGFDITLRGDTGYGGILIRGVQNNKMSINGPRRVLFKVMKYLNPVDQLENIIGLIDGETKEEKIFQTFRHGLGKPINKEETDNPEYFKNAPYRFLINPKLFSKGQLVDKEKIARSFKNKKLSYEFLGYEL